MICLVTSLLNQILFKKIFFYGISVQIRITSFATFGVVVSGNNMSTKKQLNSISYLIAECNARIDKLLNGPQNAMSAMSRMTSIVSSVTALNPLSQITTSASLHPMRIYEDEFEQYPDLSLYNLEGTSSHESKTSAAPSSGSNASLGSVATDFTPAINLTLGQILHSYHDEFFS